eukprot:COSAG01_NODE_452_length_16879_cov_474.367223_16_plen_569_part_00
MCDFLRGVTGLLQLEFQSLRTELSAVKPSLSASMMSKQSAILDASAARFASAATKIQITFRRVSDLEQKIKSSSAREQALKFELADMCDRGVSIEEAAITKQQLESEKIRLEAYKDALAGRRKEMNSALSVYPCMQNRGTAPTSQKQLMDCSLLKHFGSLKPEEVLAEKSPRTASKLRAAIQSVLNTFSGCLSVVAPALMRVLEESTCGSGKSVPVSFYVQKAGSISMLSKSDIPTESTLYGSKLTKEDIGHDVFEQYKSENVMLWNLFSRLLSDALLHVRTPYVTGRSGAEVIECEEFNFVMAVFIILNEHERQGYKERQILRDFYSTSHTKILAATSLQAALTLLQAPMADAKRLGVLIDYQVVFDAAHAIRGRNTAFIEDTTPFIVRTEAFLSETGMLHDAMAQFDVLLSIVLNRCKTQSLPAEMPSTVNLVDTTVFDLNCTKVNAVMPSVFSAVQVKSFESPKSENSDYQWSSGSRRSTANTNVTCAVEGCTKKVPDNVQKSIVNECRKQNIKLSDYTSKPGYKCLCNDHYEKLDRPPFPKCGAAHTPATIITARHAPSTSSTT